MRYFNESQQKINDWNHILETGKWPNGKHLLEKEKAGLRNQISALKSRVVKKNELAGLYDEINNFKSQFLELMETLTKHVSDDCKERVKAKIKREIPLTNKDDK